MAFLKGLTLTVILLAGCIARRGVIPDPLLTPAGTPVTSPQVWQDTRRAEILDLFRRHVYGRTPPTPFEVHFTLIHENPRAFGETAIQKAIALDITTARGRLCIQLLVLLPQSTRQAPAPAFVFLNFGGNHMLAAEKSIPLPEGPVPKPFTPPDKFRGAWAGSYPLREIIRRGYGIVTAYCGDIDPDFDDGFQNGIHPLLDPPGARAADAWGTVAAWAWGLSRLMDYCQADAGIDQTRVAVLGHSRLGKAALWAAAQDRRFAMAVSNNSGCTGAALARRRKGESVAAINKRFPHWFCAAYKDYNHRESSLPIDQHMLLALMAPRPVYVASATRDRWADPEGEFMSCVLASPVYALFGLPGLEAEAMPLPDRPLHDGYIGYHLRTGKHRLTPYDWRCFMDFADRHWRKR